MGSIGKLTEGIAGKSASGITGGALGLANDVTGAAAGGGGGKAPKQDKKAALIQTLLSALGGARG